MTNPNDSRRKLDRVTAEQVARILDSGAVLALGGRRAAPGLRPRSQPVERESAEPLAPGHSISWGAIWQGQAPRFPGLRPMGCWEAAVVAD